MKRVLVLFPLILSFLSLKAQEIHVGPQAGVNFTTQGAMLSGINMGAIIDMGAGKNFSVRSGLLYSQKGKQIDDLHLESDYLILPLTPQVNWGNKLKYSIRAGGYTGLNLTGRENEKDWDLGGKIGAGVRYPVAHGHLTFDAYLEAGFISIQAHPERYPVNIYTSAIGFSAGYLF